MRRVQTWSYGGVDYISCDGVYWTPWRVQTWSYGGVDCISCDGVYWTPRIGSRTKAEIMRTYQQQALCPLCSATDGKHYCNCPKATPENRITGPAE